MPAFSNNSPFFYNHRTHYRIWIHPSPPKLCKFNRPGHIFPVRHFAPLPFLCLFLNFPAILQRYFCTYPVTKRLPVFDSTGSFFLNFLRFTEISKFTGLSECTGFTELFGFTGYILLFLLLLPTILPLL